MTTALLGTGRRRTVEPGVVLEAVASVDAETAVLATAGARAVERRASWTPTAHPLVRPEAAAADPRPLAPVAALALLRRLLRAREVGLLAEWLTLAGRAHVRAPDEELPDLLEVADGAPDVRVALGDPGPRARWLVDAIPDLRTPATSSGGARADWEAARTPAERGAALAAIRRRDADEGRAILETDWASLSPDVRPTAIAALAEGLSDADEPVLERTLDERRLETRQAAGDLLARLPASAFAARMEARARPLIELTAGRRPALAIGLPEWSDDFARDGIAKTPTPGAGERASWRHQLLVHVAPARWTAWLGVGARELVARAAASEDGQAVVAAWVEAIDERFADAEFAAALLEHEPGWIGLVRFLDDVRAERILLRAIRDDPVDPVVLEAIPRPWSEVIGRAFVDGLAAEVGGPPDRAAVVRQAARTAASRLPASLADAFEAALFGGTDPDARLAYGEAVDRIRLREQLANAFAPS